MRSISRLLRFIKPYRLYAIVALFLLLGMVASDLLIPRLTQRIIDQGIANGDLRVVLTTSLMMLGAAILAALFALGNNFFSVRVGQSFAHDIRSALVRRVQSFSYGNLDELQTGNLITRSTSDVHMVQMIVMMSLRILTRAPIWIIGAVALLILTSPRLALMMAAFVPVIVLFIVWFARKAQPMFTWVQQKLDRLNTVLQENLAGVRVVKAFVREGHEIERFDDANVQLMDKNIRIMRLVAILMPTMVLVLNLAVAGAVWIGGTATLGGGMTVGQLVASINYLMFAMFPLMMLAGMMGPIAAANASAGRILEVLDAEPKVRERADARSLDDPRGRIAFEQLRLWRERRRVGPSRRGFRRRAGRDGGDPRSDRLREVYAHSPDPEVLRRDRRARDLRRDRCTRSATSITPGEHRDRAAGGGPVRRDDP